MHYGEYFKPVYDLVTGGYYANSDIAEDFSRDSHYLYGNGNYGHLY